jgi:hypothetical protein
MKRITVRIISEASVTCVPKTVTSPERRSILSHLETSSSFRSFLFRKKTGGKVCFGLAHPRDVDLLEEYVRV